MAVTDAIVMMDPAVCVAIIARAGSCTVRKTPSRLMDIMVRQVSNDISSSGETVAIPALATAMSTLPYSFAARSQSSATLFWSRTSHRTAVGPGTALAAASAADSSASDNTTV